MSINNTVFLCLCLSLLCLPAFAETEEPSPEHGKINTPDASPVDPGHYEVEGAFSYSSSKKLWDNEGNEGDKGFLSEKATTLSVTAGLFEHFDVSLSGGFKWLEDKDNDFDEDGISGPEIGDDFSDLKISGRYRFIQNEKQRLDVAYIGGFTIPTGTDSGQNEIGTSQRYWSFNQTVVGSKDWGKWTANADIGYALLFGDKRDSARGTFNADLAGGYQYLPWLQPEIELNYSHDIVANGDDAQLLAITAGVVMPIDDGLRINVGVQQGVWGRCTDKSTVFSLAIKAAF